VQILILDDESLDLFVAKKLLSLEFPTEGFTTEEETLDWARNHAFDVVLIDYYLTPNLLATDVLAKLRNLKGSSFKAYVLSNFVEPDEVQRLKKSGFNDVIFKPLTLENFKAMVS
jgi:CheY-like chemotaxis protein